MMNCQEQLFFDELYLRHYPLIYQFISRLIRDPDSAQDLTQDTFTVAYLQIQTLMSHDNRTGWLYKTARNLSMNHLRLKYHQHAGEEALLNASDGYNLEETVLSHFFPDISLTQWLSEKDISILTDRFEYGYSIEETAARQGISLAACKMRLSRIYQKIRKHPEILLLLLAAVEVI